MTSLEPSESGDLLTQKSDQTSSLSRDAHTSLPDQLCLGVCIRLVVVGVLSPLVLDVDVLLCRVANLP